ncbi:MAG: TetR/AcrR family transcriptional regulator [Rhodospirillales bacterium]|nr:TetR/AcrR family transcriptional regulator [Rhodospirillales bacterium]
MLIGKKDKADISRARILDAAAGLFRQYGYGQVSLRVIAEAAGMKSGSLYYHFASKEAIVVEVLDLGIEMVHQKVDTAICAMSEQASAGELLHAGILNHLQALFAFSDYTSANVRIYGQVPDEVRKANRRVRRRYEALWMSILSRAEESGGLRASVDHDAFKLMLIGSLNATLEWFDPVKDDVQKLADSYTEILLGGLLNHVESNV